MVAYLFVVAWAGLASLPGVWPYALDYAKPAECFTSEFRSSVGVLKVRLSLRPPRGVEHCWALACIGGKNETIRMGWLPDSPGRQAFIASASDWLRAQQAVKAQLALRPPQWPLPALLRLVRRSGLYPKGRQRFVSQSTREVPAFIRTRLPQCLPLCPTLPTLLEARLRKHSSRQ